MLRYIAKYHEKKKQFSYNKNPMINLDKKAIHYRKNLAQRTSWEMEPKQ